jgi:anti-sigma regulatory factor (Ser/Thr protein kinase)
MLRGSKASADMAEDALYEKSFFVRGGDFDKAGEVSTQIKSILKGVGINSDVVRRVAIATFEGELNVVIHAEEGTVDVKITPADVLITIADRGKGIEDIDQAMQEGFSTASDEMREKGFGAGMGLPNIKKNSDEFKIESELGVGTTLWIAIRHKG